MIIDCDGHILEPPDLWEKYLEPRYRSRALRVRLSEKPSYYFKRQCFISADPDERTIPAMMQLVGEDKFLWASDYPHPTIPATTSRSSTRW